MVEIVHNIFEAYFDKSACHAYNLCILFGMDRFSYLIEDEQGRVAGLRVYAPTTHTSFETDRDAWLRAVLAEDSLLRGDFRSVTIGMRSPKLTLVPNVVFDIERPRQYLMQLGQLEKTEEVLAEGVSSLEATLVYAFPEAWLDLFLSQFRRASLQHSHVALLRWFGEVARTQSGRWVWVHVTGHYVHIWVWYKGQLLLQNLYEFETAKTFVYYVQLVFNQLGLRAEADKIYLSGELTPNSEVYRYLTQYFKQLEFASAPDFYSYGEELSKEAAHLFIDLYALKLCE